MVARALNSIAAAVVAAGGCVGVIFAAKPPAATLPADYFALMASELRRIEPADDLRFSPSYLLAAAVLHAKTHPANPSFGDAKALDLALKLGDIAAEQSERDESPNRQDYEWEIHCWLDGYRLLEPKLSPDRRDRWKKALERNVRWFVESVADRADFPRYQSPFLQTSPNHYALWASTVHLAGRIFKKMEWEQLGARVMHRFAAEEQTPDGYWGEFTDNGPATRYNSITMNGVALYYEHTRDPAALEALRRATSFHAHFTWPDGRPVETIDGRQRIGRPTEWGHFGFTHWPDGRGFAEYLSRFFEAGRVTGREVGRIAQSALYYHEGPRTDAPQERPRFAHQMTVAAGIRRVEPWTYCLSGLSDPLRDSRFHLWRQGNLSVFHDAVGLIVTGANSRNQPELATIMEKQYDVVTTVPGSSRVRMSEVEDRLGLSHRSFFADLRVPAPTRDRSHIFRRRDYEGPDHGWWLSHAGRTPQPATRPARGRRPRNRHTHDHARRETLRAEPRRNRRLDPPPRLDARS
jgi:hypothetical protein